MNLYDKKSILVITAVMALVIFLSFGLIVKPTKKTIGSLDTKINAKIRNISELAKLKKELLEVQMAAKSMERKIKKTAKTVTLPSVLENVAKRTNLKDKMTGLKARETVKGRTFSENGVEISLREITIDELMEFVYSIESLPYMIKVKGFKIKTTYGKDPKHINLTLLVSLFTPN